MVLDFRAKSVVIDELDKYAAIEMQHCRFLENWLTPSLLSTALNN